MCMWSTCSFHHTASGSGANALSTSIGFRMHTRCVASIILLPVPSANASSTAIGFKTCTRELHVKHTWPPKQRGLHHTASSLRANTLGTGMRLAVFFAKLIIDYDDSSCLAFAMCNLRIQQAFPPFVPPAHAQMSIELALPSSYGLLDMDHFLQM